MGISVSEDKWFSFRNILFVICEHRNQHQFDIKVKLHTLTQIPQPMHNSSEMKAIFEAGVTSMQSFPAEGEAK